MDGKESNDESTPNQNKTKHSSAWGPSSTWFSFHLSFFFFRCPLRWVTPACWITRPLVLNEVLTCVVVLHISGGELICPLTQEILQDHEILLLKLSSLWETQITWSEECQMSCLFFNKVQGLSFQAKPRGVPVGTGDRVWWSPACVRKGGRVLVHLYLMFVLGFPLLFP